MHLIALTCALAAATGEPQPIDFGALPRTLASEPAYIAEPLYGLFLFGEHADVRVWAALDKSDQKTAGFDVLYLDVDGDGQLGEEGERFEAQEASATRAVFHIGTFAQPKSDQVHEDFEITWTEASVRFKLMWRGEKITMGGYGPERSTYAQFGKTKEKAPIYIPGYDRPFEFEHWMSGKLSAGRDNDFKVFVGNRGSVRGAFSCVDDKFLPKGEYVVATLIYKDKDGRRQRIPSRFDLRC